MGSQIENFNSKITPSSKDALYQRLEELHTQINELAMSVSTSSQPEMNLIWSNLANARACLSNAINSAKEIKTRQPNDYQI
jgi:hypothetical protein